MLYALDHSSLRPRGDLRIAVSRLNRDCGAGRNRREMLRIGRNYRKGVSLGGIGKTARAVSPDVSRIGAVDAKAFLFAAFNLGIKALRAGCRTSRRGSLRRHGERSEGELMGGW